MSASYLGSMFVEDPGVNIGTQALVSKIRIAEIAVDRVLPMIAFVFLDNQLYLDSYVLFLFLRYHFKKILFNVFTLSADPIGCSIKIYHQFKPNFAATYQVFRKKMIFRSS